MFSILNPRENGSHVKTSENIVSNLDFTFLGKEYISNYLTADKDVISARQKIFNDISENTDLISFFDELSQKTEDVINYEATAKAARTGNDNEGLFSAFRELLFFIECIDMISAAKQKFGGNVKSEGIVRLFERADDISKQTWYLNARDYLEKISSDMRDIKSISIGINLDAEMRPIEAGIISVNTKLYTTNSMFDKLFGVKQADKDYICISPIGRKEARLTGNALHVFDRELYSILNNLLYGSLKKIKDILYNHLVLSATFLHDIQNELMFIKYASAYITAMKEKDLPLCMPQISDTYEIIGNYNPNLVLYRENSEIIRNDVVFDDNGKIFILTGPNSGGKSVYLRSVGIAQILFQLGLPIPAEKASMIICSEIFTQFTSKITDKIGGRLENECKEITEICKNTTENSLVLLDELFSSTSSYEGAILAEYIIKYFAKTGCLCVYATHMHELATKIDDINSCDGIKSKVDSLCAEIQNETRTFKIFRMRDLYGSFAFEIFKKFGMEFLDEADKK